MSRDIVRSLSKDKRVRSEVLSSESKLQNFDFTLFMQLNDLSASAEVTAIVFLNRKRFMILGHVT